jgi:aerobic C4-dicarboxylate transport protein
MSTTSRPLFGPLYVQVLVAIAAGVGLGLAAPSIAVAMKPLGDGFIALLRMLLAPIIFCTVVHGIASVQDLGKVGRLGLKSLVYFEVVSTVGLLVGFILTNVFQPGAGLDLASATGGAPAVATVASASTEAARFTFVNFLSSIIPTTLVGAFAQGDILQVLLVSLLVGTALKLALRRDSVLLVAIHEGQLVLFRMLGFIMRLAPLGAFGAIAAAVGAHGGDTLVSLLRLVLLYYAGCVIFVVGVLGPIAHWAGISLLDVLRLTKDEILLVLGTASGEVAFPRLVVKLKEAGCEEAVVGFVLPAGYSFNLDGTAIYMALAVGFMAQATDTPFSLGQQIAVLAVMLLTSKGGTAVAGGAFVKLAATVQSVRVVPLEGLALLFGVDRLMATAIAVTNVIGNAVAVCAIAHWEGALDHARFRAYLASPSTRTDPIEAGMPADRSSRVSGQAASNVEIE